MSPLTRRLIYAIIVNVPIAHAVVAELADALDSGSSGHWPVEVQVLSTAPYRKITKLVEYNHGFFLLRELLFYGFHNI